MIALLVAIGCSNGDDTSDVVAGGTLAIAQAADPPTLNQFELLDPEGIKIVSQITEPLFKTDPDGELQPWLATKYEPSPDGRVVTITLRRGVEFSNGQPLTARDVVFTLDQTRDSANWAELMSSIKAVTAEGPGTVVIHLKRPSAALRANLALYANGIVPANFGGRSVKEFGDAPVGTGPFQVKRRTKGQYVILTKNDTYWREDQPVLDAVRFNAVPNATARVSQLQGGQQDVIASPPWPQVAALESGTSTTVGKYALSNVHILDLNTDRAPLTDPDVRRAISLSVDREAIVAAAFSGNAETAKSMFAPSLPYYDANLPSLDYDPEAARQLLGASGAGTSDLTLTYVTGNPVQQSIAQILQQNFKDIGLNTTLQPLDQSASGENVAAGDYDMVLNNLFSDIQDPSELAAFYIGTEGIFTGVNTSDLRPVAKQADATQSEDKRAELYSQLQQMIVKASSVVPLVVEPYAYGLRTDVVGFEVNATGIYDLASVGLGE